MLRPGDSARFADLTDSKLMSAAARDRMYDIVLARALDYAVVVIPPDEVDARGVQVANVEGMRRSVAQLRTHPGYVLTDGFRIHGFTAPSMPVIKGDLVVACIAAASVLAKVTRDRIMASLHDELPVYGFDVHKGYITGRHHAALGEHGPSAVHRWSFVNVASAGLKHGLRPPHRVALSVAAVDVVHNGGSPRQGVESGRGGARVG
jgi:ribonuclease HII